MRPPAPLKMRVPRVGPCGRRKRLRAAGRRSAPPPAAAAASGPSTPDRLRGLLRAARIPPRTDTMPALAANVSDKLCAAVRQANTRAGPLPAAV